MPPGKISKHSLKSAVVTTTSSRSSSLDSNRMLRLESSQSPNPSSAAGVGPGLADRKRRLSFSSLSTISNVSGLDALSEDSNEDNDDDDDDNDDDDDDDDEDADDEKDQPERLAPSYGHHRGKSHKAGHTASKRRKLSMPEDDGYDGQKSSAGDSDSDGNSDDDYAAVDDITDDDDEEDQDVEKLEELLIVESEDEHRYGGLLTTTEVVNPADWAGAATLGDSMLLSAASFFDDEQMYSTIETIGDVDLAAATVIETPVPRRVHFAEASNSSSDSDSYTDDEIILGDFLQQDTLDPHLRRMIENDHDASRRNSLRHSDDIFAESDYGHANIYHVESDVLSDESSGYESMHALFFYCCCFDYC